jgi:hypothetical protein
MKYLKFNWMSRVVIIFVISILVSALLVSLELTNWADQINEQGYSHGNIDGENSNIPSIMMYALPFVKELILIGIPLFLTLGLMKMPALLKRVASKE